MKPENAIEVNHISKKFKVYMDKGHTLKEKMLSASGENMKNELFWMISALK